MKKFKLTAIPKDRGEWLKSRQEGIGASEVATILGLNPYESSLELFRRKLGLLPINGEDNVAMFMGRTLEPVVANLWQYWDGNNQSVLENFTAGKKQRNCIEIGHRITNNDYPHLFCHLDRLIAESKNTMYNRDNGVLEIKTISGFATKNWENGIPPYHLCQLQDQLLITDLQYGELAMLIDGRKLEVIRFERNDEMIEKIIEDTTRFWRKVLEGRSILADNTMSEEQKWIELSAIEPQPDSSEGWTNFLKENYKTPDDALPALQGNEQLLEYARAYMEASEETKEAEEKKAYYANQIRYAMGEHQEVVFEGNGKITWKMSGKSRSLSVKLKHFEFA